MKDYKNFSKIFLVAIACFVVFHFTIWEILGNKKLLSPPEGYMVGDLARTSYSPSSATVKPLTNITLSKQHEALNFKTTNNVDVMTFGDSFSIGGGGGNNPYYQDYIATNNNLDVAHVICYKDGLDPVPTLLSFINQGYIDKYKPKYVILESVERHLAERLAKKLDFSASISNENLVEFYSQAKKYPLRTPKAEMINLNNYKFVLYNILYNFNQRAFVATTYRMKANKKTNKNFILVHKRDINNLKQFNEKSVGLINKNLNKIADILAAKGVKLYLMIAPDKYDMYYDYLAKPYDENKLFELIRKQKKHYKFIDTKAILSKEIANGNFDVYHYDDTHWCNKASEAIFKEVKFE